MHCTWTKQPEEKVEGEDEELKLESEEEEEEGCEEKVQH